VFLLPAAYKRLKVGEKRASGKRPISEKRLMGEKVHYAFLAALFWLNLIIRFLGAEFWLSSTAARHCSPCFLSGY